MELTLYTSDPELRDLFLIWLSDLYTSLENLFVTKEWKGNRVEKKLKKLKMLCYKLRTGKMYPRHYSYFAIALMVEELAFAVDKQLGLKPVKARFT